MAVEHPAASVDPMVQGIGECVPYLVIVLPLEGRVRAAIRGCRDEHEATGMRAWLESRDDLSEICQLVRELRDRQAA